MVNTGSVMQKSHAGNHTARIHLFREPPTPRRATPVDFRAAAAAVTLVRATGARELKFTEKRSIFFCKLRRVHRFLLVKHLPKGAEYIRQCISSFFDLKITQDLAHKHSARHISGESLWFNHRFDVKATNTARGYYANTIDTTLLSDIINSSTNNVFTYKEWRAWIQHLDHLHLNRRESSNFIGRQAKKIDAFMKKVPADILHALKQPTIHRTMKNEIYALIRPTEDDEAPIYASFNGGGYDELWLDALGIAHETGNTITLHARSEAASSGDLATLR